jgi:glyoxylase-like metal-dependent hydrolase (beta-lactamase superfamily II)
MPGRRNSHTGTSVEILQIIPFRCGMVNAYRVREDGVVLIDTGIPGSERAYPQLIEGGGD